MSGVFLFGVNLSGQAVWPGEDAVEGDHFHKDDFVRWCRNLTSDSGERVVDLSREQLGQLFDLLDINGSGSLYVDEAIEALPFFTGLFGSSSDSRFGNNDFRQLQDREDGWALRLPATQVLGVTVYRLFNSLERPFSGPKGLSFSRDDLGRALDACATRDGLPWLSLVDVCGFQLSRDDALTCIFEYMDTDSDGVVHPREMVEGFKKTLSASQLIQLIRNLDEAGIAGTPLEDLFRSQASAGAFIDAVLHQILTGLVQQVLQQQERHQRSIQEALRG